MRIDGKDNVKKRIKVFENDRYTTYLYIFENGNKSTIELTLYNLDTDSKINNSVIIKSEYLFEKSKIQTYSKVSNWTYKKILEILEFEGLDVVDYGGIVEINE